MPVAYSVASVPYLFTPTDLMANIALNADLQGIGTAITNLQKATAYPITQFGAVGDGVTDNTVAIQNTVNAAQIDRGVVYIPNGVYLISGPISINSGITVQGAGCGQSFVIMTNATQNGFNVLTIQPVNFRDFTISSNTTLTTGAGIIVLPVSGENFGSRIENMEFDNMFTGIAFIAASGFYVGFCKFAITSNTCIFVENTNNPDSGDSVIIANNMQNLTAGTSIAINHASSGGLKIIGNKINVFNFGYALSPTPGIKSSITIINDNSIENITGNCIDINSASPTDSQWRAIEIVGNELQCLGGIGISISGGTIATWLAGVTICGNSILFNATGTGGIGILTDWVTGVAITGNYLEAELSGITTIGIDMTANTNGVTVIGNVTRFCNTSISNSATNSSVANNIAI